MESSLKDAGDWASSAETKSGMLEKEAAELKTELGSRKPKDEVIDAFKQSTKYSRALADVAAKKLLRCWVVAEKHIKTDPESSWEKFIDLYIEVEEAFVKNGTEPEPYNGPAIVIPQISKPIEAQTDPIDPNDAQFADATNQLHN